MSTPYQGNQYFTSVQNSSSLSVQDLNVDTLETSNLSVGNTITLPVLTSNPGSTSGSYRGQLAIFYYSSAWTIQVYTGSAWQAL